MRSEQGAEDIPVGTRLVQGARAQMTKDMHAGESAPEWGGRAHTGRGSILFGVGELELEKTGWLGGSILAGGKGSAN